MTKSSETRRTADPQNHDLNKWELYTIFFLILSVSFKGLFMDMQLDS